MWASNLWPEAFAAAFAEIPPEHIWEWADKNVLLLNEDSAEPGEYRSVKTPWTRRLQELGKSPVTWEWDWKSNAYVPVPVGEINWIKSSQSGVTEAVLNIIRHRAKFAPCNTIYAIDTDSEAKKIARRLLRSFKLLDAGIFTGDPDDIKSTEFLLRGMELIFYGSFSSGKFANKQAPLAVADEVEEHGSDTGDTSSTTNLESRKKTADGGLQINLSKPKKENGPIDLLFKSGNREEFFITCPHCKHLQWLTFFSEEKEVPFAPKLVEIQDEQTGEILHRTWEMLPRGQTRTLRTGRLVFSHCKDLLGQWDYLQISRDTYFECGECKAHISEDRKLELVAAGIWLPTAVGIPGVVSQHINDLYSGDRASSWGQIALDFLKKKAKGRAELQGFYNHRLGIAFANSVNRTEHATIRRNIAGATPGELCVPYKRGTVPFVPAALILGSDVGGNYAKWALGALHTNAVDIAVLDWGEELDPDSIAHLINFQVWPALTGDKRYRISAGFMDGRFRRTDIFRACLAAPGRKLIPCAGLGGAAVRVVKAWSYTHVPTYRDNFKQLTYTDSEAKDEMYERRLRDKKSRLWFPIDVGDDPEFMNELCAESRIIKNGREIWDDDPPPNHYGDCVKLFITGSRFLTRKNQHQHSADVQTPVPDVQSPVPV